MKNKELNIAELSKEFDNILASLGAKEISNWIIQDEINQAEKLISGKSIVVENLNYTHSCTIIEPKFITSESTNEAA